MRNDYCESYLMHKDRTNHKYVAKIKLPSGKFYYFYNLTQYQNYMKGRGGKNTPQNFKKDPNRKDPSASDAVKKQMASDEAVQALVSKKTPGTDVNEKVQYLRNTINAGNKKISSILNEDKSKSLEETNKSSKKSGGSGSSKSSGKKSKGASSGAKGSSKGNASKEKSSASKAAKDASKNQTSNDQKKSVNNAPINMDTLKKIYGKEDKDISSFEGNATDFKNNMLSKYKEGSFGYLTAGNTTYKWEISDGKVILKDYNTDKEVSFDSYLKDAKNFKEFKSNTKKK